MKTRSLLCAALLAALPVTASAEGLTWSAALTSDYLFRGIDQNDDQPALQASLGYGFANGFYVGAWGSNVDFGNSTDTEIDTYIGWAGEIADGTTLDVQLVRYNYLNEPANVDGAYNELIGKLGFAENFTATLGYTNDYVASDVDSFYYGLAGGWTVAQDYNLTAGVGYTTIDGPAKNYFDYGVGINRDFGSVNIALGYIDTSSAAEDNFGPDIAEDKFTLTFTIGS
jgi:uncharacterized protein (TIGR02001 family)